MTYDTIVIGGGPTGLTLASYLPGSVCLIEGHDQLGGCHRVERSADGLFGEHAPRVYSGAYVNARNVLADMGISWSSAFRKISWNPSVIDGVPWYGWMGARTIRALTVAYAKMIAGVDQRGISVAEWCEKNGIPPTVRVKIDLVCRASDGAGAERYSLHQFLRGFDAHVAHAFYQPRVANDVGLFPRWSSALRRRGVELITGDPVIRVFPADNNTPATVITESGKILNAAKVVLAMPPQYLPKIVDVPPSVATFARITEYNEYPAAVFHFRSAPAAVRNGNIQTTPNGLVALVYDNREPTVCVSVAARRAGTGLRIDDMLRELGVRDMPVAVVQPQSHQEAFVAAAGAGSIEPDALGLPGIYTVGCHNGKSNYEFTSFESAVQNALAFLGMPRARSMTVTGYALIAAAAGVAWFLF